MSTKRIKIPSPKKIGEIIGIPDLEDWKGKCFGISSKIVEDEIIEGKAVYGHYLGEIAPYSYFYKKSYLGFVQHGWIRLPNKDIIDPTRWVFEDIKPYIAEIDRDDDIAEDYDEGGNKLRFNYMTSPPKSDPNERMFASPKNKNIKDFLSYLLKTKINSKIYFGQIFWIANLPPDILGENCTKIYKWLIGIEQEALIPMDNRLMILN